jgi:hypothetical protein
MHDVPLLPPDHDTHPEGRDATQSVHRDIMSSKSITTCMHQIADVRANTTETFMRQALHAGRDCMCMPLILAE